MLLDIVFVNLWGVLQLVALASLGRTVRVRTVLLAVATGVFLCVPLAALLEYGWTAVAARLLGKPSDAVLAGAGYTVDPFLEQVILLLPLAGLLLLPVVRRQGSITDCVLIGAATGAGFGLAEDLYRFGSLAGQATSIDGGWLVPARSWQGGAAFIGFVPDLWTSMHAWLPDIGAFRAFPPATWTLPNVLLIWAALGGFAVGLVVYRGWRQWKVAIPLLLFAAADHAAHNAEITVGPSLLTAPFRALGGLVPWMPLVALAAAIWIDRHRRAAPLTEHLLAAEREASSRWLGTLRAALSRPPASIALVDRLVRLRRAYDFERSVSASGDEDRRLALTRLRDHVEGRLAEPGSFRSAARAWQARAAATLRRPRLLGRLALMSPFLLWFVVGGWPATAGLQRAMSAGPGRAFVIAVSIVAQLWLAWRLLVILRWWRGAKPPPFADPAASLVLQTTAAGGALCFGAYGALQAWSAWPTLATAGTAHGSDAFCSQPSEQSLPMANGGPMFGGPGARPSGQPVPPGGEPAGGPESAGSPGGEPAGAPVPAGSPVPPMPLPFPLPELPGLLAGEGAGAGTGVGLGTVALGGAVAGAGILAGASAIDHAGEVATRPDPDVISPPGGTPADPTAPTLPAPGPTVPAPDPTWPTNRPDPRTWPAPPGETAGDDTLPLDPTNPHIPRPPRLPNIPDISFPDDWP